MVAKLAIVIIAIGAAFGALLVNRQQRVDAVAEMARSQLRMEQHRRTITRLQAAVAEAVRPSELRLAADKLPVVWEPIPNRFDPLQVSPSGAGRKPRLASDESTKPVANRVSESARRSGHERDVRPAQQHGG